MSSFSGLTNALASLNAQRYGLDVTGQNVSNANTAGYTRQRVDLAEVSGVPGLSSIHAGPTSNGGVTVAGTSRLNYPVLDSRARMEHAQNGMLQTRQSTLSGVEGLFNEPSDTGLSEQLNKFWNAWGAVANNPGDPAARNVVLQQASGLASSLNGGSAALSRLTQGVSDQLNLSVQQINTTAASLAQVNGVIAVSTATGTGLNSLADQRDSLMLQLADLTGGQATIQVDGSATVVVGGQSLVSRVTTNAAAVNGSDQLTIGGTVATGVTGSVGGLMTSLSVDLPAYASQLDSVAAALAGTVNGAQAAGYDLSGASGGPIFSGASAATITVSMTDPAKIAASGTTGGNLGGSVALQLAGAGTLSGGPNAVYSVLIGGLGSQVQAVTQQACVQQSVTTGVDNLVQSQSGVSLDEESTNLLTYQRAYQASSRVLTTVDETLDTLINHTGRAGL